MYWLFGFGGRFLTSVSCSLSLCLSGLGDGLESQSIPEGVEKSVIAIPEDFESREEMVSVALLSPDLSTSHPTLPHLPQS